MEHKVTILRGEPTIIPIAEMSMSPLGLEEVMDWVETHRPECLPDRKEGELHDWKQLFPHNLEESYEKNGEPQSRALSWNELLVEFAGRTCYSSYGLKAGRKSNAEYIAHMQNGDIPHMSVLYHAQVVFFFAGLSRRVSHELIRNYVGSDRDEKGSPSQESTRFTHHHGFFIEPPKYSDPEFGAQGHRAAMQDLFAASMESAYNNYLSAVSMECASWEMLHGKPPTSLDKKRIYEAASSFLPHQAETSWVWSTNVAAIAKLVRERANSAADLEIQRFAKKLRRICIERWSNCFPQPWMHE